MRAHFKRLEQRAGSKLVEGFFSGLAYAGRLHPASRPERHGIECVRDLAYLPGGDKAHLLDLYIPPGPGPHPVVFYVHGGGFRILSKETHWLMGLIFARRGFLVVNVNYRLAPQNPYPAALEDVVAAYRWTLAQIGQHGGDPSRLVFAGESAGANLITALTLALAYERPEPFAQSAYAAGVMPLAVLPACGLFQVTEPERFDAWPGLRKFVRARIHEVTHGYIGKDTRPDETLALADPLLILERGQPPLRPLPPFFMPVGTADPLEIDTQRMLVALHALGVPAEARYYAGEIHAFHAMIWRKNAQRCWGDTMAFLGHHGLLPSTEPREDAAQLLFSWGSKSRR